MMRRLALAWLVLLAAAAPDRPLLMPQRDVDVTYDVPSANGVLHQRMRWDVADRLLRVDPPTAGLFMIVSYADNRMSVVRAEDRTVLQLPTSQAALPGTGAGAFTRLAEANVAGLACTEWQTTDTGGQDARICLTPDGVLLRASNGAQILLVASQVAYAAQPARLFQPPAGYRLLTPAGSK